MDTIPDRDFLALFRRSAKYINFKGALNPEMLNERLRKMQREMLEAKYRTKNESTKRKLNRSQKNYGKLRKHGFSRRVFDEAIADPRSIYALSLKYGFPKAMKIKLKEAEERLRRLNRRRRIR